MELIWYLEFEVSGGHGSSLFLKHIGRKQRNSTKRLAVGDRTSRVICTHMKVEATEIDKIPRESS